MNKSIVGVLALFGLVAGGCYWTGIKGNGKIVTEQRQVSDFTEIKASGGILEIEWHAGPPSVSITTDKNLLPHVEVSNSGNILKIRTRDRLRPTNGIKMILSSAKLSGADLTGGIDLIGKNLTGPKFYLRTTGGSDVKLDGTVDRLSVDLTGAGDLRAKNLQVKEADISTTGAASAYVSVSETLRVSITGAGDVNYYGTPKTIEKHILGAGSVSQKQ